MKYDAGGDGDDDDASARRFRTFRVCTRHDDSEEEGEEEEESWTQQCPGSEGCDTITLAAGGEVRGDLPMGGLPASAALKVLLGRSETEVLSGRLLVCAAAAHPTRGRGCRRLLRANAARALLQDGH